MNTPNKYYSFDFIGDIDLVFEKIDVVGKDGDNLKVMETLRHGIGGIKTTKPYLMNPNDLKEKRYSTSIRRAKIVCKERIQDEINFIEEQIENYERRISRLKEFQEEVDKFTEED